MTGAGSFRRVLGGAPHRPGSLLPHPRDYGQILGRRFQAPPLPTIADVSEELTVAWRRRPVCPRVESRPHKPTVRARGRLIDAADAMPADRTRPRFLSQGFLQVKDSRYAPPNGVRLSCGALKKKVSFNILRAPPASSAC